jgi:hypothetical protein
VWFTEAESEAHCTPPGTGTGAAAAPPHARAPQHAPLASCAAGGGGEAEGVMELVTLMDGEMVGVTEMLGEPLGESETEAVLEGVAAGEEEGVVEAVAEELLEAVGEREAPTLVVGVAVDVFVACSMRGADAADATSSSRRPRPPVAFTHASTEAVAFHVKPPVVLQAQLVWPVRGLLAL